MDTVTSVSGGRTSAYLAANYPADRLVFALVRIEDERCRFPDEILRRRVEDRIQAPFIATAEDDMIVYTIFDLEQYLGKKIDWVTGPTYDWVIANHRGGGYLPNKMHRFCTTDMKMEPICHWWRCTYGIDTPILMNIGYRSEKREINRANEMLQALNENGFSEMKITWEKHPNGDNKWVIVAWRRPLYPLIEHGINKSIITGYWKGKPVRFADYNNCVGCMNREALFLRYMFQVQPAKMRWFKEQEMDDMLWQPGHSYSKIEKLMGQQPLYSDDFNSCDSGYCEMH